MVSAHEPPPVEYALQYAALGWHVFPIRAGGKNPLTQHGHNDATTDPAIIRRWWMRWPNANIGIRTGRESGLVVVDTDIKHHGGKFGDETLEALEAEHGTLPDTPIVLTASGGYHHFFRYPADAERLAGGTDVLGSWIDIRADGGYVVAAPSFNAEYGRCWEWEGSSDPTEGAELAPLPAWIREKIERRDRGPADKAPVTTRRLADDEVATIREALAAIPKEKRDDRGLWVEIGMALSSTGGEQAFELWDTWSQRSSKYDPWDTRRVWDSFGGSAITIGTLYHRAREHGWTGKAYANDNDDPAELTPHEKRDLGKDLAILERCAPAQAKRTAVEIVKRYIRATPRRYSLEDLLAQIQAHFPGTEKSFGSVRRRALWQERDLQREAIEAINIDPEALKTCRNVAIEQREDLDGLAHEIVTQGQPGPIYLVKAPMGCGKTKHVIKPVALAKEFDRLHKLAVTHRVSLVRDLCHVAELVNYQEVKAERLSWERELGICINSLANPKFAPFVDRTGVLLVDEISQVCREMLNPFGTIAKSHGARPNEVWSKFVSTMRKAPVVVGCDADLNTLTVKALAEALPDREIRVIEIRDNCANITVEHGDERQAFQKIMDAVRQGRRVLIGTDAPKMATKAMLTLQKENPDIKIALIHSQPGTATNGEPENIELLSDINSHATKYDVLIYSPTISSGVSLETRHFDEHIFFYYGAVAPSDFIQMMRRDRTATRFFVGFCRRCANSLETNPVKILNNLAKTHERVVNAIYEATGEWSMRVMPARPYDALVCEGQSLEAKARNNAANNLLYLLEARGYTVQRGSGPGADKDEIKAAGELQREAYKQALETAADITGEQRDEYRQQYTLTAAESAEVARFEAKRCLGLRYGEPMSETDLELWDQGALAPKAKRFDALRTSIGELVRWDLEESEAEITLSLRRQQTAQAEALQHVFETLELDRHTGEGEITAESALEAWRSLKASAVAASLIHFKLCRFQDRPPDQPVRWVSDLLGKLNLQLVSRREGGRGEQRRTYSIATASWETMEVLHRRRKVAAAGSQQGAISIHTPPW